MKWLSVLTASLGIISLNAVSLDLDDSSSVNSALALIAKGLMDYYEGTKYGGTVGMMTDPYYWWEAGTAFSSMIDFWYYTGNSTYNDIIKEALLYQVGTDKDYMPANQTTSEGNDDQGFWGLAVLNAAEKNFTNPTASQPQWIYLAEAVWNDMYSRWDTSTCSGGLRWQIYSFNAGYDYKNTVSNGCFFTIGARLARYTGNSTYVEWCEKIWNWLEDVDFIDSSSYKVIDGGSTGSNCETHSVAQWSYNFGLMIAGTAYLYSHTNDTKWEERATGLFKQAESLFFENDIMYEQACQAAGTCNTDQRCFKGIFSRFLGSTALLVPSLQNDIMTKLNASATAAAASCSGGSDGHTCGLNWFENGWDGKYGLGEQICALDVIANTQVLSKDGPLTNTTGGTSSSTAGKDTTDSGSTVNPRLIETKDRAGAGVVTVIGIVMMLSTGFWMLH